MSGLLGDGPTSPIDQGVATSLFVAAVLFGWIGVWRLRGRGFARVPKAGAAGLLGLAGASVVLALVLPPILRPGTGTRPSTSARLSFVFPAPGRTFRGNPATVQVTLRLIGGRAVPFTSTRLIPNEGHVHLLLDGRLILMTPALRLTVTAPPGPHRLVAEFVAVDHRPFEPRVIAAVSFVVKP